MDNGLQKGGFDVQKWKIFKEILKVEGVLLIM